MSFSLSIINKCNMAERWKVQVNGRLLSRPRARTILVDGALRERDPLIPFTSFEILVRLAFPALSARVEPRKLHQSLSGGCVMESVDCFEDWDIVYRENLEASVALLKMLLGQRRVFLRLSKSPSDTLTVNQTMESFRRKPSWSEQIAPRYYVRATEKLADDEEAEMLFVAFSEFEERCKEPERARFIYKFALDHIPTGRAKDLYKKFVAFYKQCGDKDGMPLLGRGGFSMKMKARWRATEQAPESDRTSGVELMDHVTCRSRTAMEQVAESVTRDSKGNSYIITWEVDRLSDMYEKGDEGLFEVSVNGGMEVAVESDLTA
ncbi:Tetratricopeptide-like helical domain protein [Raphanus sativus]|nr:Tetratricopeptide-like helical domain protein [Raphanus sativus]